MRTLVSNLVFIMILVHCTWYFATSSGHFDFDHTFAPRTIFNMFVQLVVWNFTFSKFQTGFWKLNTIISTFWVRLVSAVTSTISKTALFICTNLFPFQKIFSRYIRHFFCAKLFNSKSFEIFFFRKYLPCPCTFSVKIARNSRKYYGYFALAQIVFSNEKVYREPGSRSHVTSIMDDYATRA